jgi:endoglucanase
MARWPMVERGMRLDSVLLDRRRLLVTAAAVLAVGCSREGEGKAVARKSEEQVQADPMWSAFRQIYLDASGRIVDNGNGGISHSEGQGYGMVLAVQNGDRPAFEAMVNWTQSTLARPDVALFSWRYDPRQPNPVADPNNATDGDLLIAWAMARASRLWGVPAWEARSAQIRAAIRNRLVVERFGQHLLLPGLMGFDNGQSVTLNPSYFIWPALDAFAQYDGESTWGPVIESAEAMLRAARFGAAGLPTDWIVVGPDGKPAPAPDKPPRFGFDAVRVPLYAMAGHRASLAAPIADFWRAKLAAGQVPAWVDVTTGEQAPYALSPGARDVMHRLLGQQLGREALAQDYYGCVLQLLARDLV